MMEKQRELTPTTAKAVGNFQMSLDRDGSPIQTFQHLQIAYEAVSFMVRRDLEWGADGYLAANVRPYFGQIAKGLALEP